MAAATGTHALARAEHVATLARTLGIETAVIGAVAMAMHNYVRATRDIDLGAVITSLDALRSLRDEVARAGFRTELREPDDADELGGVLDVWQEEDEHGEPIEPIQIVNFFNPLCPKPNPGVVAVRRSIETDKHSALRCVSLADLIAVKLSTGALRDQADVVDLLARNSDADRDAIRAACAAYSLDAGLDQLFAAADALLAADRG